MPRNIVRSVIQICTALAVALVVTSMGAGEAAAQKKSKSIKTEGRFVSFDTASNVMTVKVVKPGKKPKDKGLAVKNGREAEFDIKPEGSVLTRTSVTLNGKRAHISDVPEGQLVIIYWAPHETKPDTRFARKIDMVLSDQELAERDKQRMEAEKAAGRVADDDS
jgi:hypothetical protein